MKLNLKTIPIESWLKLNGKPILISGPCSAETEEQLLITAKELAETGRVQLFRAGIWKPRTRPSAFEGVGETGLKWLQTVKEKTGLPVTTEVANAKHAELCLEAGIDVLWVGARTSVNPFSVQEIADALRGTDIPILIKNPISPDLHLWIGALERINKAGITKIAAVHRGFSSMERTPFRNAPMWEIPIELKTLCPSLPILCDPSHITGNSELIQMISQKAIDLDMHGLMIETHFAPKTALSDSKQQLTPKQLCTLLDDLIIRDSKITNKKIEDELEQLRNVIDDIDDEVIQSLSLRMDIAERIGEFKKKNKVTILQAKRWDEIVNQRIKNGLALRLSEEFIRGFLKLIHSESIRKQSKVMNSKPLKRRMKKNVSALFGFKYR